MRENNNLDNTDTDNNEIFLILLLSIRPYIFYALQLFFFKIFVFQRNKETSWTY